MMKTNDALQGKRILITREQSKAHAFESLILAHQGIPITVPLLKISCRRNWENEATIISNMDTFKWIFFTSAHGVDCFFTRLGGRYDFSDTLFATVGHKTEQSLRAHGFRADFIPTTYNAEVMSEEFFKQYPNAEPILLVRGNISRPLLVEEITNRGLVFDKVVVYDTLPHFEVEQQLIDTLLDSELDYLTFTSPSTVQAFMTMTQRHEQQADFLQIPAVCIGTTTARAATDSQFKKVFVPDIFTIESMVDAIVHLENKENVGGK